MSEQQQIERLEDLDENWQRELLALSQDMEHVITVELWRPLHSAKLIRARGDLDELTAFASELVSDYQQRHGMPRTIKPTYEQLEAENARLRAAINERARTIIVLAEDEQGEWQDVSELYAPEWTEGYRAIIEHAQILLNQLDSNK